MEITDSVIVYNVHVRVSTVVSGIHYIARCQISIYTATKEGCVFVTYNVTSHTIRLARLIRVTFRFGVYIRYKNYYFDDQNMVLIRMHQKAP